MAKWSDFETHPVGTSDRIKELTTGLASMATRVAEVSEGRQVLLGRIEELEGQLKTAMEGLTRISNTKPHELGETPNEYHMREIARATIAELKGQDND